MSLNAKRRTWHSHFIQVRAIAYIQLGALKEKCFWTVWNLFSRGSNLLVTLPQRRICETEKWEVPLFFPTNWELNILRKVTVRPRWAALLPSGTSLPRWPNRSALRDGICVRCSPPAVLWTRQPDVRLLSGRLEPGWQGKKRKVCSLQPLAHANHGEIIAITVHFPSLQRHVATLLTWIWRWGGKKSPVCHRGCVFLFRSVQVFLSWVPGPPLPFTHNTIGP